MILFRVIFSISWLMTFKGTFRFCLNVSTFNSQTSSALKLSSLFRGTKDGIWVEKSTNMRFQWAEKKPFQFKVFLLRFGSNFRVKSTDTMDEYSKK